MNLSLDQIVNRVNKIHIAANSSNDPSIIKTHATDLSEIYKHLQKTLLKVDNIYNICNNKYKNKKRDNRKPNPRDTCPNLHTLKKCQLTDNIHMGITEIDNVDKIPNTTIYWVSNINQFAIKINGVLFRGDVGNIYHKDHIKKNKKTPQISICKHENNCKSLLTGCVCKFYHDPLDLLDLVDKGVISAELYDKYKHLQRNFLNTSWLQTEEPISKKNNAMRHFGSRDTLKYDLDLMKINDFQNNKTHISNYQQQCMHDMLIIMGLNQHSL